MSIKNFPSTFLNSRWIPFWDISIVKCSRSKLAELIFIFKIKICIKYYNRLYYIQIIDIQYYFELSLEYSSGVQVIRK